MHAISVHIRVIRGEAIRVIRGRSIREIRGS